MAASAVKQLPPLTAELYREVFINSHEAIAIISPEGKYIEQNGAHFTLLGYSDEELTGQTPAIHLGEEVFGQIVSQLTETGLFRGEVVSHTRDGEERHLDLSAFAMRNSVGEPVCYVGIKRDITERKQAEEALRRSEAELADFFQNAALGMHWVGPEGKVLRVNQKELDLLGYEKEEFVGHHIREFHCDPVAVDEILRRLETGEIIRDYETRMRAKDGSIKYVEVNSSRFTDGPRVVHNCFFIRDITQQKWSQQRLRLQYSLTRILSESNSLMDSASEILAAIGTNLDWAVGACWQIDNNQEHLYCVRVWRESSCQIREFEAACYQMKFSKGVGLPGHIWATGRPFWIPDVLYDKNFPRLQSARKDGLHAAFGFPVLAGKKFLGVIELFSHEIREPDEDLLRMLISVGNQIGQFQEKTRAERALERLLVRERAARSDAEQANRLKDEFLATVSHELRTPLNAVIGWSRMLRSGRLDSESSEHALEVIERNAWAQKQIIDDILDVSRVITGKLTLKLGAVDLHKVIDAALDAVRPAFEAKGINIATTIDENLRIISGDADRLQQVIWNLLSNAARFTPLGGNLEIIARQENNEIRIQVKDTGPGIDPQFLPHVFERFRQADGSTTRTHGGLGLGLAIVRHLVELHGGTITAENREDGTGAIMTLTLPCREPQLPETTGYRIPRDFDTARLDLRGLRVLVVDDEADALDLITMELTEHGANVSTANSALAALTELDRNEYDLLIGDIGMPGMDGYELIRRVRRREDGTGKRLPAIALTAYAGVQDRLCAIMAGYNSHVSKPLESNELVAVIASISGRLSA